MSILMKQFRVGDIVYTIELFIDENDCSKLIRYDYDKDFDEHRTILAHISSDSYLCLCKNGKPHTQIGKFGMHDDYKWKFTFFPGENEREEIKYDHKDIWDAELEVCKLLVERNVFLEK